MGFLYANSCHQFFQQIFLCSDNKNVYCYKNQFISIIFQTELFAGKTSMQIKKLRREIASKSDWFFLYKFDEQKIQNWAETILFHDKKIEFFQQKKKSSLTQ